MEREIEGRTYSIGVLDTFTQLHVARKLGMAVHLVDGLVKEENKEKDLSILTLLALSQISDDAADFVIKKCLSVVRVKQGSDWARLANDKGGIQFDDTPMAAILKLTAAVVEENLGGFFRTSLGALREEGTGRS